MVLHIVLSFIVTTRPSKSLGREGNATVAFAVVQTMSLVDVATAEVVLRLLKLTLLVGAIGNEVCLEVPARLT